MGIIGIFMIVSSLRLWGSGIVGLRAHRHAEKKAEGIRV